MLHKENSYALIGYMAKTKKVEVVDTRTQLVSLLKSKMHDSFERPPVQAFTPELEILADQIISLFE